MVKGNVVILRREILGSFLHRLFQNGAHPLDLQLGIEGSGDILKHQPQGIIKPGGGKEESQKIEEGKFSGCQHRPAGQNGGCQPQTKKSLSGTYKHAGCQLGMDGALLHGGQLFFQFFHIGFLAAAGLNIPYGFQSLLDAVRHRPLIQDIFCPKGILNLLAPCRQQDSRRNYP